MPGGKETEKGPVVSVKVATIVDGEEQEGVKVRPYGRQGVGRGLWSVRSKDGIHGRVVDGFTLQSLFEGKQLELPIIQTPKGVTGTVRELVERLRG